MSEQVFSDEELEFLRTNANERGWYLYSENARPIIDGLCERGLMGATGAFKPIDKGETISLFGVKTVPLMELVSYYALIRYGKTAFRELEARP
jgi:hypothetical protein